MIIARSQEDREPLCPRCTARRNFAHADSSSTGRNHFVPNIRKIWSPIRNVLSESQFRECPLHGRIGAQITPSLILCVRNVGVKYITRICPSWFMTRQSLRINYTEMSIKRRITEVTLTSTDDPIQVVASCDLPYTLAPHCFKPGGSISYRRQLRLRSVWIDDLDFGFYELDM